MTGWETALQVELVALLLLCTWDLGGKRTP
jgi:hypothetical protein